MSKHFLKIRVNYPCSAIPSAKIPKLKKGDTISIECDKNGIPLNRYWYRRMKDAVRDHCIEIVKEKSDQLATSLKKKG